MDRNLSLEGRINDLVSQFAPIHSVDGIHDSLTYLPAPTFFYEQLQREILIAERNREPFQLIRICLAPRDSEFNESHYEIALINFSKGLKKAVRVTDFIGRLGRLEFFMIFHGTQHEVREVELRIAAIELDNYFYPQFSSTTFNLFEGILSIMRRVEEEELHIYPQ